MSQGRGRPPKSKTCPKFADKRKQLTKAHRPTKKDRERYAKEWLKCRPTWVRKCANYIKRGCSTKFGCHMTPHGIFCQKHYVEHPRCTVEGCENLAVIDPMINKGMLCRDHLFEEDTLISTPFRTRSMIADCACS